MGGGGGGGGLSDRGRMVVEFTTTFALSCEFESRS